MWNERMQASDIDSQAALLARNTISKYHAMQQQPQVKPPQIG
jgi:hypothetical protein